MMPNIGDVVSVHTDQSFDEKYKYIILVGIHSENANEYLGVFINKRKHNLNHVDFEKNGDRKFLEYDSFVDCGDPKRFGKDEIVDSILKNEDNFRGTTCKPDIEMLRKSIVECTSVKRVLKKYFLR